MAERHEDIPIEDRPADRRGFFREGFASLLGPLAGFVQKKLEAVERAARMQADPAQPRLLRPPGALPEDAFLRTCTGCGDCVTACPAEAIYLVAGPGGPRDAKPVINAQTQPCVLCDSLACMPACQPRALVVTSREQIRMGLAEVDAGRCLRSGGEACTLCVDTCPIGKAAIHLEGSHEGAGLARVVVEPDGCTGCGVCEFRCPTDPRSIVVQPNR
ncbi:MAG: hypothetical protein BIFFINMI_00437 [Phycisphaerae bacterium]|nr:hypothetical protein [Phycisphaerae bacterium]